MFVSLHVCFHFDKDVFYDVVNLIYYIVGQNGISRGRLAHMDVSMQFGDMRLSYALITFDKPKYVLEMDCI